MSLRRADGFRRYALSVQYHGASFLGFSYQGSNGEDCILPDGTDLRGFRSVEGRIREGLTDFLGCDGERLFENIQVSSRTDRGVHAVKNTFHVDIRHDESYTRSSTKEFADKLQRGLGYFLTRQRNSWDYDRGQIIGKRRRKQAPQHSFLGEDWMRLSPAHDVKILSVLPAPDLMRNHFADHDPSQPAFVDWNARFSATERTYIYRILNSYGDHSDYGAPFEWDRSWRIQSQKPLNVEDMQQAASLLQGTHDYSSFRGRNCQRDSPVVTIHSIDIESQPYGETLLWGGGGGMLGLGCKNRNNANTTKHGRPAVALVSIKLVGNSFLYRQVRNMVGCLVEVGLGKLKPQEVHDILQARDRSAAPRMSPAHGLFLVDVQHGDFTL